MITTTTANALPGMRFLALCGRHSSILRRPRIWFGSLLRLEGETDGSWLPSSNSHSLSLSSVSFVPSREGVAPRWYVVELERAAIVAHAVRALYHHNVGVHPGMNVALDWYGDFLVVPSHIKRWGSRQLRLVPLGVLCGLRVNVVRRLVTVQYLHVLTRIDGHYMRDVLTTFLVNLDRLCGNGLVAGQALGDIDDNIRQPSVRSGNHAFCGDRLVLVNRGATRLLRHVNRFLVWSGAVKFDATCDLNCRSCTYASSRIQQNESDHQNC